LPDLNTTLGLDASSDWLALGRQHVETLTAWVTALVSQSDGLLATLGNLTIWTG
jgi:hypothetical protein